MDISIQMGNEKIDFNLFQELTINSADINHEVTRQAQLYGFLGLVAARLTRELERRENSKDKIYERLYVQYKGQKSSATNRVNSDDLCKAKATVHSKYQSALKKYIQVKYDLKRINQALDAFKQRKDLMQTFSSNNRNNS